MENGALVKLSGAVHMVKFNSHMTFCGKSAGNLLEGTWDDITCLECVSSFLAHLEKQKKMCYQYVSGDQLELSDPELLESLNKKIEKCETLLQKLDQ